MAQRRINGEVIDAIYNATLGASEDQERGWDRNVNGAAKRRTIRRVQTTTDGTFLTTNAIIGGVGRSGDYLTKLQWEVAPGGLNAGIWLSQPLDPILVGNNVPSGGTITNTAAQTFVTALSFNATKNQHTGRVASFTFTPTGGVATIFKSRIVSHPAWNSTNIAMTLEDTPPAGSQPASWQVEGVTSRRICEPGRAAGFYEWLGPEVSEYGGFIVTMFPAVYEIHATGDFT